MCQKTDQTNPMKRMTELVYDCIKYREIIESDKKYEIRSVWWVADKKEI